MAIEEWIDRYIKLMFPVDVKNVCNEEALQLKKKNMPEFLYKYRAVNEFSLNNLKENTIWFNNANKLNDPYDCFTTSDIKNHLQNETWINTVSNMPFMNEQNKLQFTERIAQLEENSSIERLKIFMDLMGLVEEDNEELNNFLSELSLKWGKKDSILSKRSKELLNEINETNQSEISLTCFSERNDSILMWSHYAQNHSGFCVEYDFGQLDVNHSLIEHIYPVIYSEKIFNMTPYLIPTLEDSNSFNNFSVIYGTLVKSIEWSYEEEWRIVRTVGKKNGFNLPFFKPRAIYLGSKITEEDKETVIKIAVQKQIPVFQMKMKNNEFKLVPEQVM